MSERPSLHEIAAMPFPMSIEAMRKHYNPKWAVPVPEGEGDPRPFKVTIEYETRTEGSKSYEVIACSEDEAEELAQDKFDEEFTHREEVMDVTTKDLTA